MKVRAVLTKNTLLEAEYTIKDRPYVPQIYFENAYSTHSIDRHNTHEKTSLIKNLYRLLPEKEGNLPLHQDDFAALSDLLRMKPLHIPPRRDQDHAHDDVDMRTAECEILLKKAQTRTLRTEGITG